MTDWTARPLMVFDLECTCWAHDRRTPKETIEIGAVMLDPNGEMGETHQAFVRPVDRPALSDFCKELTGIRQDEVDGASPFPTAMGQWVQWIEKCPNAIPASWGDFDRRQLLRECRRHEIPFPFTCHLNLKTATAKALEDRPRGMDQVLARLGLLLEGAHHRGLDDAMNIARIVRHLATRGLDLRQYTHTLG